MERNHFSLEVEYQFINNKKNGLVRLNKIHKSKIKEEIKNNFSEPLLYHLATKELHEISCSIPFIIEESNERVRGIISSFEGHVYVGNKKLYFILPEKIIFKTKINNQKDYFECEYEIINEFKSYIMQYFKTIVYDFNVEMPLFLEEKTNREEVYFLTVNFDETNKEILFEFDFILNRL